MADDVQREARALGDPTRYRIFRYIAGASGRVGVAELARHVGLNQIAVRQHLAALKEAGIVLEESERRDRPGRPRLLYRLHPEAANRWDTPDDYVWLAGLRSRALHRRQDPRQAARRGGAGVPPISPVRPIRLTSWRR